MRRKPYPSDLSDGQWAILEPLIPLAKPGGRPRSLDMREVLNAIFAYPERWMCLEDDAARSTSVENRLLLLSRLGGLMACG